ncbi:triphosphoribosyl-dephospho-CoA synthase [Archaeoglobus profundus]|uniref:Triphosphoribosyl-dephospho-CoA protein n=1 Tax=Archaeoglobus profundus (strain DSM 5631 / JCM 9629 / NBRC 100127 / Av18) TaxID=572546 RepID=D2RGL3_ARCPA|nr:triphosphoribosyl-dephospho-CoA synthase [Archaeoglobus profundus]ADB57438.1 triphosphoribosyl-dephospho-CoA protein [Archaeoglobus profundus DSM 5631]
MPFESMNDAQLGVLSLLLEVSANPKPGNVDREHEFSDLKFEHFILSAISAYPAFEDCMNRRGSIGTNFFNAVVRSYEICRTNVHFGAFFLLIPLIWCGGKVDDVEDELKKTTHEDSLAILSAFRICKPRVMKVKELDLRGEKVKEEILEKKVNLYHWLEKSPKENVVARELVERYWRSLEGCTILRNRYEQCGNLNEAIVYTYIYLLSKHLDPLVIAKHGLDTAYYVKERAEEFLDEFSLEGVRKFDEELVKRGINPGSIADLTCSSIYLALKEGLI